MITDEVVGRLQVGDLVETGIPFTRMAPLERCSWKVIEIVDVEAGRQITLHAYWKDVFLKPVILLVEGAA